MGEDVKRIGGSGRCSLSVANILSLVISNVCPRRLRKRGGARVREWKEKKRVMDVFFPYTEEAQRRLSPPLWMPLQDPQHVLLLPQIAP